MHTAEEFAALLTEVGPALETIEAINVVAADTWQVAFEPNHTIDVQLDETGHKVCCVMPLGPLPEANRSSLYETMLAWTLLKDDTGGFHLATDGGAGNAFLMLDVSDVNLDADLLAGVLEAVLNMGRQWQNILTAAPADSDTDVPVHEGMDSAFLRA